MFPGLFEKLSPGAAGRWYVLSVRLFRYEMICIGSMMMHCVLL
jgi:hypothetical protein